MWAEATAIECVHTTNVGAGLLAKAVDQSYFRRLTHRFREQAPSHIDQMATSALMLGSAS